jgi:hypothetical protein
MLLLTTSPFSNLFQRRLGFSVKLTCGQGGAADKTTIILSGIKFGLEIWSTSACDFNQSFQRQVTRAMQLQSTYSSCFRTWRLRLFAQAETNSRFYDFQSNCFPGDVCVCQLLSVRRFSFCSSESKQESRTEAATSTGASGGRFVSSPSCAPA